MFLRGALLCMLAVSGCVSAAYANSCSNVLSFGSNDKSGISESDYGLYAVGTFRIASETDESKQPMFNFATVNCEKQRDDSGRTTGFECKIAKAVVWADAEVPNTNKPNCLLDLDSSTFLMKELQKGILAGADDSTSCFSSMLTIDRNTKRVYMNFTRTKYADNYDRITPGTCSAVPRQQVLMNCTYWAGNRKGVSGRYCDFSSSSDKR